MARLEDKVCIITGSGSGIGRASALMFAREGARVIVADIRGETAEATAHAVCEAGGTALAMTVDVAREPDLETMIARTVAEFGRIDVLFNNALYVNKEHALRDMDFLSFDPDIFLANLRVNVLGAVLASKLAIPHMLERGGGSIISTSSGSSMGGDITAYSYGSSKAALNWFVQAIAATYGKRGIRSNAILPGPTQTPAKLDWSTPEMDRLFLEVLNTPFIGEPEDIAAMALFLASDESRYVNGMLYPVDGGQSCTVPFIGVTRALMRN
ncbi:SDR family NAD(P)-dependent oxidoreductase [Novosphingobium resinovorum]|uniref:Alcohol dehydrogenase n=1 Tax=Novosphingobium resinovorum TaxID=158500 RepID=A0A1D8AFS0_9SPHN|nr:SDR family oxidoreductase [Novosphingobium resinovorum]AOR80963.1 alcohol dehydrogenase [Novosphingobium resinovorum]